MNKNASLSAEKRNHKVSFSTIRLFKQNSRAVEIQQDCSPHRNKKILDYRLF